MAINPAFQSFINRMSRSPVVRPDQGWVAAANATRSNNPAAQTPIVNEAAYAGSQDGAYLRPMAYPCPWEYGEVPIGEIFSTGASYTSIGFPGLVAVAQSNQNPIVYPSDTWWIPPGDYLTAGFSTSASFALSASYSRIWNEVLPVAYKSEYKGIAYVRITWTGPVGVGSVTVTLTINGTVSTLVIDRTKSAAQFLTVPTDGFWDKQMDIQVTATTYGDIEVFIPDMKRRGFFITPTLAFPGDVLPAGSVRAGAGMAPWTQGSLKPVIAAASAIEPRPSAGVSGTNGAIGLARAFGLTARGQRQIWGPLSSGIPAREYVRTVAAPQPVEQRYLRDVSLRIPYAEELHSYVGMTETDRVMNCFIAGQAGTRSASASSAFGTFGEAVTGSFSIARIASIFTTAASTTFAYRPTDRTFASLFRSVGSVYFNMFDPSSATLAGTTVRIYRRPDYGAIDLMDVALIESGIAVAGGPTVVGSYVIPGAITNRATFRIDINEVVPDGKFGSYLITLNIAASSIPSSWRCLTHVTDGLKDPLPFDTPRSDGGVIPGCIYAANLLAPASASVVATTATLSQQLDMTTTDTSLPIRVAYTGPRGWFKCEVDVYAAKFAPVNAGGWWGTPAPWASTVSDVLSEIDTQTLVGFEGNGVSFSGAARSSGFRRGTTGALAAVVVDRQRSQPYNDSTVAPLGKSPSPTGVQKSIYRLIPLTPDRIAVALGIDTALRDQTTTNAATVGNTNPPLNYKYGSFTAGAAGQYKVTCTYKVSDTTKAVDRDAFVMISTDPFGFSEDATIVSLFGLWDQGRAPYRELTTQTSPTPNHFIGLSQATAYPTVPATQNYLNPIYLVSDEATPSVLTGTPWEGRGGTLAELITRTVLTQLTYEWRFHSAAEGAVVVTATASGNSTKRIWNKRGSKWVEVVRTVGVSASATVALAAGAEITFRAFTEIYGQALCDYEGDDFPLPASLPTASIVSVLVELLPP